jgi:acetyl-CoA carboxylase carboxyl transferase subunit alpha
VISPEGCAAILWKDRTKAPEAAAALKLNAKDLLELGLIDDVIKEPLGGAHHDPDVTAEAVKAAIKKYINEIQPLSPDKLVKMRYEKFRAMGVFEEKTISRVVSRAPAKREKKVHEKRVSNTK